MARVASLHVYPVKSCRGIDLATSRLTPTGLEWDRRWMIVDAAGRFVTQRENARLASIASAINGKLRLAADGLPEFVIDLHHDGPMRKVRIWKHVGVGIDAGDEAADWLMAALGAPYRLVRVVESEMQTVDPSYAGPGNHPVTFTDGYPILMISRASLQDLNERLPAPLPMNRFRPNIVIDDVPAYAEDAMAVFRIGKVAVRGVKPCTRCVITTTDQVTCVRDDRQEPLRTLKTYRYDAGQKGVAFGQNCVVEAGVGERLAVGTELTIEDRRDRRGHTP